MKLILFLAIWASVFPFVFRFCLAIDLWSWPPRILAARDTSPLGRMANWLTHG